MKIELGKYKATPFEDGSFPPHFLYAVQLLRSEEDESFGAAFISLRAGGSEESDEQNNWNPVAVMQARGADGECARCPGRYARTNVRNSVSTFATTAVRAVLMHRHRGETTDAATALHGRLRGDGTPTLGAFKQLSALSLTPPPPLPPPVGSERRGPHPHVERGPTQRNLHHVPRALQALVDDPEALEQGERGAAGDADDAHQAATR